MSLDRTIVCSDCRTEFVFTESEQEFFASKGFTEPRRCPACRAQRKAARNGDSSSSPRSYSASNGTREMFSAICSSCGQEARVPFQPSGNKPVYCSDCFRSR